MAAPKELILRHISQNPEYTVVDPVEKGLCTVRATQELHDLPTEGYERGGWKEDADRGDHRSRSTLQQVSDEGRRRDLCHMSDGDLVQ